MGARFLPSLTLAIAAAALATPPVTAQTAPPKASAPVVKAGKAWTPFERPPEFEGKRLDEITPAELAKAIDARNNQKVVRAPTLGGAETGAGPTHWFEDYNAKNTHASSDQWSHEVLAQAQFGF